MGWTGAASKPKVLLANEPRSYRQAIAHVLRALRPDVEVAEMEQAALDRELRRSVPQLVICSRATVVVQGSAPAWVELYTDYGPLSYVATTISPRERGLSAASSYNTPKPHPHRQTPYRSGDPKVVRAAGRRFPGLLYGG